LQLFIILDEWSEALKSGGKVDIVYTDFEKTFDKVPRKKLTSKLHSYKVKSEIVQLMEADLSNRKQRVKINGFIQHGTQF
jgi:hypothetical protein